MSRKLTEEQFLQKCKDVGAIFADDFKSYVNSYTKLWFKCPKCSNTFLRASNNVFRSKKIYCNECCAKAATLKRITNSKDRFFQQCHNVGITFVDDFANYRTTTTKLKFQCVKCGSIFTRTNRDVFRKKQIYCPKCSIEIGSQKQITNQEKFIQQCYEVGAIFADDFNQYKSGKTKLKFQCPICNNIFIRKCNSVINGKQIHCRICAYKVTGLKLTKDIETVITQLKEKGFQYISGYVNLTTKCTVKCHCGKIFKTYPRYIISGWTKSCGCLISNGENIISSTLDRYQIAYAQQKTYNGLYGTGNGLLKFDFYLPNHNTCIEYNGEQHYQPIDFSSRKDKYKQAQIKFSKVKQHDKLKRDFCKANDIKLIVIKYTQLDQIEEILRKKLKLHLTAAAQQL